MIEPLGALFAYPDASLGERLATCRAVEGVSLEAREALERFAAGASELGPRALEELYTRTFDMTPRTSLEIGWHLYGEQYERGAFLVRMRRRLRELGLPENHELPDHLSHALALLARLGPEEGRAFAAEFVLPALGKILESLSDESNPYRHLLSAALALASAKAIPEAGASTP